MTPGADQVDESQRMSHRHTNASADKDGDFIVKDILCRSTVWTINTDPWEGASGTTSVNFDKRAATPIKVVILLDTLDSSLGHGSNNGRSTSKTLSESVSPVTHLADVD